MSEVSPHSPEYLPATEMEQAILSAPIGARLNIYCDRPEFQPWRFSLVNRGGSLDNPQIYGTTIRDAVEDEALLYDFEILGALTGYGKEQLAHYPGYDGRRLFLHEVLDFNNNGSIDATSESKKIINAGRIIPGLPLLCVYSHETGALNGDPLILPPLRHIEVFEN